MGTGNPQIVRKDSAQSISSPRALHSFIHSFITLHFTPVNLPAHQPSLRIAVSICWADTAYTTASCLWRDARYGSPHLASSAGTAPHEAFQILI